MAAVFVCRVINLPKLAAVAPRLELKDTGVSAESAVDEASESPELKLLNALKCGAERIDFGERLFEFKLLEFPLSEFNDDFNASTLRLVRQSLFPPQLSSRSFSTTSALFIAFFETFKPATVVLEAMGVLLSPSLGE